MSPNTTHFMGVLQRYDKKSDEKNINMITNPPFLGAHVKKHDQLENWRGVSVFANYTCSLTAH